MGYTQVCRCPPKYRGPTCAIHISDCARNPCYNGGTCYDLHGDFGCICPPGFSGKNCDVKSVDECVINPCKNGGSCYVVPNEKSIACICPFGDMGNHCEYKPREFPWVAVFMGAGLVGLLVLLFMIVIVVRHFRQQPKQDTKTMNNLSDFQKDNLIPASQLKNINKKKDLEVDFGLDKSNYKLKNHTLDCNITNGLIGVSNGIPKGDNFYNSDKCLEEEKYPLRFHR